MSLLTTKSRVAEEAENRKLLSQLDAKRYRELAARANYLAQDRMDIQYATKEICRGMCRPTRRDVKKLSWLGSTLSFF